MWMPVELSVESYMLLGLGFGVAALTSLVLAPSLWRWAAARTRQRIADHTHLSMEELSLDKEKLRSELSVTTRKLDLAVQDWRDQAALQLVKFGNVKDECSTALAHIDTNDDVLSQLEQEVVGMRSYIDALRREVTGQLARLAEQSQEMSAQSANYKKLNTLLNDASALADERKVEIVSLRSRITRLNAKIDEMSAGAAELRAERTALTDKIKQTQADLNAATRELEALRSALAQRESELAKLKSRLQSEEKNRQTQAQKSAGEMQKLKVQHTKEMARLRAEHETKLKHYKKEKSRLDKEVGAVLQSLKNELIKEREANENLRREMTSIVGKMASFADPVTAAGTPDAIPARTVPAIQEAKQDSAAAPRPHPLREAIFKNKNGGSLADPAMAGAG